MQKIRESEANKMIQKIPEYSKYMYLEGYKPEEILSALHQKMINEQAADDDEPEEMTIKTIVEVKK